MIRSSRTSPFLLSMGLILFGTCLATAHAATPLAPQSHPATFFESSYGFPNTLNPPYPCSGHQGSLAAAEADCAATISQVVLYFYPGGLYPYNNGSACAYATFQAVGWLPETGYPVGSRWTAQIQAKRTSISCPSSTDGQWGAFGTTQVDDECPPYPTGGQPGWELAQYGDPFGTTYSSYCLYPPQAQASNEHNAGCPTCDKTVGNPINVAAGNKYETATDYRGNGAFPLVFSRTYNSIIGSEATSASGVNDDIGKGWITNLGAAQLYVNSQGQHYPCTDPQTQTLYDCPVIYTGAIPVQVTVWHADGSQATFDYANGLSPTPTSGTALSSEATGTGQLSFSNLPAPLTGNGYRYLRNDGYAEYYDSSGKLLAVQNPMGLQHTYSYNGSGQLASVTDPFGRQLSFTYDGNGRVSTLATPAGNYSYAYDANGNLAQVTYPDNSTVQYKYENSTYLHALTGLVDENGNRYATWGYDAGGRAISSQHAGGVDSFSIRYITDTSGNFTSAHVTEPTGLGRDLTFTTINGVSLMTSSSVPCTQCGDKSKALSYDANGFVSSATDFDGNVTNYVHDAFGNETSRTEAYGTQDQRTISTQWDAVLNQPTLISEPGRSTAYTYDETTGQLLTKTVTDTATNVARNTSYAYNSQGLLYTVTDPLGHVTTYIYDSQGNLSSITNALNQVTQITRYDANGLPLTLIDPNGIETDLTYDARLRLVSRTVAGAQTQFVYDKVGNLTQVTLPTGSFLKYSYDAAHRLTGISDSLGNSISYTLDNLGNRVAENTLDPSNTLQKTLGRTYNSLNQLIKVTGGAGQVTQYTPDTMGNVTAITDPMSQVTNQIFDPLNRLQSVVDTASGNTTYNMDPLDRVADVSDPKGLDTHYIYDAFGDVTEQDSPDTGTTTYTYDQNGNRLTKTDARGIQATYSYDALNRLTAITYPDASRNVSYTYDQCLYGSGHLCGLTDASGTTAYSYDAHGNVTQKSVTLNGHVFTVGYQYDTADNLTVMTYPSGMRVSYTRDSAERVTAVTANNTPVVSGITYEPFGPITGLTYGNGLAETRSYDQDYRLTGISVPGVLNWSFTDNADNDITTINDNLGANSQTFSYDNLNRLTSAAGSYGSQGYNYDADGNRLSLNGTGYNYDATSNKLLTVGGTSRQYDAVGNLTGDGSHSYNYDAANRLTGFGSITTAYLYNGLGQRAIKFPVGQITTPTVSINTPASGATVSGIVSVTATASDSAGIASVQFQLDGGNLGAAVTSAPYSTPWNTASATPGAHSLTAIAIDTAGNSATSAAVNVTVADAPATANNGTLAATVGTPSTGTLSATPAYTGQTLTFAVVTNPTHGAVTVTNTATGAFTYTPTAGYVGSDSFTFQVTDGYGTASNTATENVAVVDQAATANNGGVSTLIGAPATGTLSATQAYTGQTLTFAIVTPPAHGNATLNDATAGTFTYTPAAGYVGSDSFTFAVTDAQGTLSNTATESLTITDVAATANSGTLSTQVGTAANSTLSATAAYTGQTLSYAVATNPVHGTVTITSATAGAFTYTPAAGYVGSDSFTFTATDANGTASNVATVSITVTDVAATANNGSLSAQVGTAANGTLSATAAYTGQTLSFAVATSPVHGTVTITNATTGAFTYTLSAGYVGSDSFTFTVTDAQGTVSNTATESLTITDVAATANNGSVSTPVGVAVNGNLAATPAYTSQALTFNVATTPAHGTVTLTNATTGAFTYTPAAGYVGSDGFTFTATDTLGTVSNTATESLTITDVAATATNGSLSTSAGTAVAGSLSATPAYTGQTLSFAIVTTPAHGSVTLTNAATGAFTYTPTAGYIGPDSFTFQVTDGYGSVSNSATESVLVTGALASLTPSGLNFGSALLNTTSGAQQFTLANLGNAPLNNIALSMGGANPGDFASTSTCGTSLGAGASCIVSLTFTPSGAGNRSASVTIADNSVAGSTQTGSLSGVGLTAVPTLSAAQLKFGTVAPGSYTQSVTLTNTGTGTLAIASIALSGATKALAVYAESNNCGSSLAPGASCTLTVTFTPTAKGSFQAQLNIVDNATNVVGPATQSVHLSGDVK